MKTLTGGDIRREFLILTETVNQLTEKFVKSDDPSVSILDFTETVSGSLKVVKSEYQRAADDRRHTPSFRHQDHSTCPCPMQQPSH